ncbi:hypothetical protein CWB96_18720 [Pseudoalteromonas citrea]|uniref:DUF2834 domain-containing protein n=1 Tax=Pseudoalteromonas citrea TaxID=43655 RepID=A0A5S3XL83_9GAMM|nr:DUF2834 domain-containing protein [Pseudoalteromonas citrea]TMP41482.1 hypothetical protein CWB97_14605 [Pseudoalteromonas citrea]TMP54703.1 hypothetical protein CWB96_18720 [Pseudoalteromonas citrea]
MAIIYLILAVVGIVFPYAALIPWLVTYGFDISLIMKDVTVNGLSTFAWLDVLVTGVALLVFMVTDSLRNKIRYWWVSAVGLFIIGVSFALPFYLYLRERQRIVLSEN